MLIALILGVFFVSNVLCAIQEPTISDVTRRLHGSYGPLRDFQASDCDDPVENYSRCTDSTFVWHWNNRLQGCERKIWKGCKATRNNFITEKNCRDQATPVCSKKTPHRPPGRH